MALSGRVAGSDHFRPQVSGTVPDAQGAVVAGAKVTLTGQIQGTTRTAPTNAEGIFVFTPILPTTYKMIVEAPGFKRFEKTNILVSREIALMSRKLNRYGAGV